MSSSSLVSSLYYPKLKRAYKKTAMMWMSVEYFCRACPVVSHLDIFPLVLKRFFLTLHVGRGSGT
jgi:hypothetical protein